jgi:hypothetical protein
MPRIDLRLSNSIIPLWHDKKRENLYFKEHAISSRVI